MSNMYDKTLVIYIDLNILLGDESVGDMTFFQWIGKFIGLYIFTS